MSTLNTLLEYPLLSSERGNKNSRKTQEQMRRHLMGSQLKEKEQAKAKFRRSKEKARQTKRMSQKRPKTNCNLVGK